MSQNIRNTHIPLLFAKYRFWSVFRNTKNFKFRNSGSVEYWECFPDCFGTLENSFYCSKSSRKPRNCLQQCEYPSMLVSKRIS